MSCTFSSLCVDDSPSRVSQSNEELDQNSLCKVSGNEISFYSKQNLPQIQAEKSYEKVAIWLLKHDLCDKKTLGRFKAKQGENSDKESNTSNMESDESSNADSLQKPSEKLHKALRDYTACKPIENTTAKEKYKEVKVDSNSSPVVNELYHYKSRKDNISTKEVVKENVNNIINEENVSTKNNNSTKEICASFKNKEVDKEIVSSLKNPDIPKEKNRKAKDKVVILEKCVKVKDRDFVKERDKKAWCKDVISLERDVHMKDIVKEPHYKNVKIEEKCVKGKFNVVTENDVKVKIKDILKERRVKTRIEEVTAKNIDIEDDENKLLVINEDFAFQNTNTSEDRKITRHNNNASVKENDVNVNVNEEEIRRIPNTNKAQTNDASMYETNTVDNKCTKAGILSKGNKKLLKTLRTLNAENNQTPADVKAQNTKDRIIDNASKAKILPRSTKALHKTLKRLKTSTHNINDSTNNKNESKHTTFLLKPSKTQFKLEESSSYLNLGKINLTARSLSQEKIFKVKLDGMFDEYKNPIVKRRNILKHEKLMENFVKHARKKPSKALKKVEINKTNLPLLEKEIVTIKKAVPIWQSVEKVDNYMNTDPFIDAFTETESTVTTSYLTSYDERSSISKIAVVKGHRRAGSQTIKAIENEYKLKRCVIQSLPCESAFPKLDISVTRVQTEEVLLMTRTTSTTSLENLLNDIELRQLKQNKNLLLQHGLFRGKTKQEAKTQVSLHLALNDLYTLRWINCYLFSTNMLAPYHLIIDDKIRSESEMAIVGSIA